MRYVLLALAVLSPSTVLAVDLSLSRASSIRPIPVGSVSRTEMAPPDGVAVAPARARPAYEVTNTRQLSSLGGNMPSRAPVPAFNPVKASFCLSEVL